MATYSVADGKNNLPRLIDKAVAGEAVVITRHGKPIVELRPTVASKPGAAPASCAWLRARRQARPPVHVTPLELLDQLYEGNQA
jgi:prevent-host-death family protein